MHKKFNKDNYFMINNYNKQWIKHNYYKVKVNNINNQIISNILINNILNNNINLLKHLISKEV